MALAENIVNIATAAAERAGLQRVTRVEVNIGVLAAVIPEALETAFAASRRDTVLAEATLALHITPGAAWCKPCAATIVIKDELDACPRCGGYDLRITAGREMRVTDMEGY